MNAIVQALGLLTPFDIDIPKVRIGPARDGGYVLADKLRPSQNVVSYGVSDEYGFDAALAARGHRVYMFDHTIDGIDAADPNMLWCKQGVAARSQPQHHLYTIEDHIRLHGIGGDDLLMQMDVEGAEIDVLGTTPDAVLARFEQIVVEVHWLTRLTEPLFRHRLVRMLTQLNKHFTLFHVHDNNHAGGGTPSIVSDLPCVSVLELSHIRTASVRRRDSETLYPTAYVRPNNPSAPEKKLWFYPFAPSRVAIDGFAKEADRLARQVPPAPPDAGPVDEAFDIGDCFDLAVGKPATQSSTSPWSTPHDAMGAVAGVLSGSFGFHTAYEAQPWWQVDLGAAVPIEGIVVYNRADAAPERAYDLVLELAGETGAFEQIYERSGRPFGNRTSPARIPLGNRRARYVRIRLPGTGFLHLDAVEVFVRKAFVMEDIDGRDERIGPATWGALP